MEYIKGYKIRIFPTKEQERKLWQHIGACRFIWNYMLNDQEERYKNGDTCVTAYNLMRRLKPLKNDGEHDWLYEVSNRSLQKVCNDLAYAYKRYFKGLAKHPKFKSKKKTKPAYPISADYFYFKDDKFLNIEKVGKVKYKTDFQFDFGLDTKKYKNARVSYKNGKWFVSFAVAFESQERELSDVSMGIDLGVKDLAIVEFNGEQITFHNINKSKKVRLLEKESRRLQRSISRKYEQNKQGNTFIETNNIMKEKAKLRKIYARLTNIRENYIHQITNSLVSMAPKRVVMETLSISGMMKNRHLSKAVGDQNLFKFIRWMKYKCEWNGIEFVQADRFFPSSKLCSNCGCVKHDLKLKDRVYVCDDCGFVIDRDYNAAINLSRYVA